jgi:signal peptidase I
MRSLSRWINPKVLTLSFWLWSFAWLALAFLGFKYIAARYVIGVHIMKDSCIDLTDRVFILDRQSFPWRGDLFGFVVDPRTSPFYPEGTIFTKYLAAVPGDEVVIDHEGVHVNGKLVAKGLAVAEKLKRPESDFYRRFIVPAGHYFALGTHERSFDSRYWGLVREEQIIGRAVVVPYFTDFIEKAARLLVVADANAQEAIDLDAIREIRDRTSKAQEQAEQDASILGFKTPPDQAMEESARKTVQLFKTPDLETFVKAIETAGKDPNEIDPKLLEQAIVDSMMKEQEQKSTPAKEKEVFHILVSTSLGEGRLKELFSAYAGREDVVFDFQGILSGQKIEDFMEQILKLIGKMEPQPNVSLNPLIFQKYGITSVPVMLLEREDRLIAKVEGLPNVEWLKRKLKHLDKLPLIAKHGQTVAIAERNLMEVIAERFAAIDWEEKKKKAIERFWSHQEFFDLPPPPKDRVRMIDMRVKVPQDILTPDGKVIAKAGDVLNPLEKISFKQALIIFDATSNAQISWAKTAVENAARNGLMPVLIATKLPKGKEWERLEALEQDLKLPIYLLFKMMKERFEIEYAPSLIEPFDDRRLKLSEFRICERCS